LWLLWLLWLCSCNQDCLSVLIGFVLVLDLNVLNVWFHMRVDVACAGFFFFSILFDRRGFSAKTQQQQQQQHSLLLLV
jgi:hypothetical protein